MSWVRFTINVPEENFNVWFRDRGFGDELELSRL
jgi:hypothetical protein